MTDPEKARMDAAAEKMLQNPEVRQAMAQGAGIVDAMARAAYSAMMLGVPWERLPPLAKAQWRRSQITAIRALPPGWVVAKVPEPLVVGQLNCGWGDPDRVRGYNAALTDFRASAVEVE